MRAEFVRVVLIRTSSNDTLQRKNCAECAVYTAWPVLCYVSRMDIRHRISAEDAAALTQSLAARGEKDAAFLTTGFVSLAALTLAMPFSATNEGGLRLAAALIIALVGSWIATRLIDWWRVKRTRWFPQPSITGLEPVERRVSVALESIREISELGERTFRWRAFEDIAETKEWIALRVSERECLIIPRSALKMRGLAESEMLMALVGRGGR